MGYGSSPTGSLVCSRCGKENFAFASFCHHCGEPFEESEHTSSLDQSHPDTAVARDTAPRERVRKPAQPSQKGARGFRRRESILGIFLIVLTLAYVLYAWQKDTSEANAYHQGLTAEQNKDWDKAADEFNKAGDLRDSQKKRDQARSNVAERDHMYQLGLIAAGQGNWAVAISSFTQVEQIQPGFSDSATRLKRSISEAFRTGLAGLVYLVSDGPQPGLYLRDGRGETIKLPGSDKHSLVHAISPDSNIFIYDRPSVESDYASPAYKHDSVVPDPFGSDKTDRIPVLAQLSDSNVLTVYPLPRLDPGGQGVFSASGLWWFTTHPGAESFGEEVFYDPDYTSTDPGTQLVRVSDIQNNKRVVAVDPPRSKVIIAVTEGGPREEDRATYLYLADAAGNYQRLVHKVDGDVLQASVSADGRRLLYINQEDLGGLISRTAWIAPLDAGTTGIESHWPMQLQILSWSGLQMDSRLTAAFLPQTDLSGKALPRVITNRVQGGHESMVIHDLSTFAATTVWQGPADGVYGRSMSGFSQDGDTMALRKQPDNMANLQILDLRPGSNSLANVELRANPIQIVKIQYAPLDNYVIASVQNPDGISRGISQEVYSLHVGSDAMPDSNQPKRIAYANLPYEQELSPVALPSAGYLLTYVMPGGELHAVFYDGTGDTQIADNVAAVWSLKSRTDLSWWR